MNKEKSAGEMGFLNATNFIDSYKEHVGREGFFVGGRHLGRSSMHVQGAETHSPVYSADYGREEYAREAERFHRHQEKMAAIVAEQEEEDFLILLIL